MKEKKDLGIYIHIPFCMKKCDYCDFLSFVADQEIREKYVNALMQEIEQYKGTEEWNVTTIFIGGGTPSMLEGIEIATILDKLKNKFSISNHAEITIESNPGTLTKEKLDCYKSAGIHRLSIGLQSAQNEELKLLGRIHSYEAFQESYELARKAGFENINVDLMSALPDQTKESWRDTLRKVQTLEPEHISAYSLIIEEDTPFYECYKEDVARRDRGKVCKALPSEEVEREMYYETSRLLQATGYQRYEISNYAKFGYECRHNSAYWTRKDYLGFGLGAASFVWQERHYNHRDLKRYIMGDFTKEKREVLSQREQMEETMFLGLRLREGVSLEAFEGAFQVSFRSVYGETVDKLEKEGFVAYIGERIGLTDSGIDLSNYVLSQFLL